MSKQTVQVAVGVIIKDASVLMAERHAHQHQGNCWEFPGGKLEANENPFDALQRELLEEVNLNILAADFLFDIEYTYPDKQVCLHIFNVTRFTGEPQHQEGQVLLWQPIKQISALKVPDANQKIIDFLITGHA